MKCFYHSADLDGHCSAAIIKHRDPACELIGIDYGQPFPWDSIDQDEQVVMVDFSLQPFADMVELNKRCNLIWLDHHISAMEEAYKYAREAPLAGYRDETQAGCELAWDWAFCGEPVPVAVKLLGRYDLWDHRDPYTLPFQWGMRLYDTDPGRNPESMSSLWRLLFASTSVGVLVTNIISEGKLILKYQSQENEKYCRAAAFETNLDGLKCIAMNKMLTNSQLFDSVWNPNKYDAMLTFGWRGGKWVVSLYSTKSDVDCSAVAKNYGGGGHKGAAGFQCSGLPFLQGR